MDFDNAESKENKRSIQILLETAAKLGRSDGLHHLIFNAENQTESIANLTKTGMKFRSDSADDFYTRAKMGTEKTSSEMLAYFKPFLIDYNLTPADSPHNLRIADIMNDNKNYHIFSTKFIKDRRQKSFYILHLLQEIINHETEARHPVLIYLEEIRFLTPNTNEGFSGFLASTIKDEMSRFRNMGRGFSMIGTTQVWQDVHQEVADSFNENVYGKMTMRDIEKISKALKLTTQDTKLLTSLGIGDFVVKTKDEFSDEPSLQKTRWYFPPHAHKEPGYSFFEWFAKRKHEEMRQVNDLIAEMTELKNRVAEEVETLKDKENLSKRDTLKAERDAKAAKDRDRNKSQTRQLQRTSERKEVVDDRLKEAIYQEWQNATGRDKSTRNIARKFKLFMTSGEPNHKAVQRAITYIERKKAQNETNNDDENVQENNVEENTNDDDETNTPEELFEEKETTSTE